MGKDIFPRDEKSRSAMTAQAEPDPHRGRATPVVTVFLTTAGKIALFRRSDRVGTYKGAWAGVSGHIERLPLNQAYVELDEETGLSRDDVELCGIGVPVVVKDDVAGRTWMVHPFLFSRSGHQRIAIDWEADSIEWVSPESVGDKPTVPGLDRALASVWPPFGDSLFWIGLSEIARDSLRGATELAMSGLEVLELYVRRDDSAPRERAARAFAACRASMGIFPHLAARFLADRQSASQLARTVMEATTDSASRAAQALASHSKVLTISYSSAVKEALAMRAKSDRALEVLVMESRPKLEGLTLARELVKEGIRVSVITDAQAGLFVREVDAVVVGCDAITENDELQNKVGTSLLVMSARSCGTACFAVGQTFKVVPPGFPHPTEEQEPDEVGRSERLRFRNLVFDTVPLDAFEAVFTEDGPLSPERLASIRKRLDTGKLLS